MTTIPPSYGFKSDHFLKDDLIMTFQYLLETKTPHKEVVIPFLDFPAFNKKQKDKDFIHPKAYKGTVHKLDKSQQALQVQQFLSSLLEGSLQCSHSLF